MEYGVGDCVIVDGYGSGLVLSTFGKYDVYVNLSCGTNVWAGPEDLTMLKAVGT